MKYFLDFGTHKFEGLEEFIPKLGIDNTYSVYCFEPNKTIFDLSQDISEKYKSKFYSFKHFNLAVIDYTGKITFNSHKGAWNRNEYIEGYTTGSNCLDINPKIDYGNGVIFDIESTQCNCVDIDEIISSIVSSDSDAEIIIKCDIEGSEFVVLPRLISSQYIRHVKCIFIEWHERFWYDTNEYYNKIQQRQNIINNFNMLGIQNYVHT